MRPIALDTSSCVGFERGGTVLFSLEAHFEQVPGLRLMRCWAEVLP